MWVCVCVRSCACAPSCVGVCVCGGVCVRSIFASYEWVCVSFCLCAYVLEGIGVSVMTIHPLKNDWADV